VAITPDGGYAYFTNQNSETISVIDTAGPTSKLGSTPTSSVSSTGGALTSSMARNVKG
jgi:DNA-binding beta-propeller fold protein YncE